MAPRTVLIAGASIAGPTLAYWLDRHGLEPTVVERAPELRLSGQNVDVRGAGRVVARRTGIEDEVRAAGTGEQGFAFVDDTGTVKAALPVDSEDGASFTAELEILRGDLAQILYDHTRDRVPYRFEDKHHLSARRAPGTGRLRARRRGGLRPRRRRRRAAVEYPGIAMPGRRISGSSACAWRTSPFYFEAIRQVRAPS